MTHRPTFPLWLGLGLALVYTPASTAVAKGGAGSVEIPLGVYEDLMQRAGGSASAPAGYALGDAKVHVTVTEKDGVATAKVRTSLRVQVLESDWVLVPMLTSGTAVTSVTVDGSTGQLVAGSQGLAWVSKDEGSHTVVLAYEVDVTQSSAGSSVTIPVPHSASTKLTATVPGRDSEAAVMPAVGVRTSISGANTEIVATVPQTTGFQLTWRGEGQRGHAVSRAVYRGKLDGDAIEWTAQFTVELFASGATTVDLLPSSVALKDVVVDGKTASILRHGDRFATLVKGKGVHKLTASFLVPVVRGDGPPQATLHIQQVPVSRFELTLPGKKTVTTQPAADVGHKVGRSTTVASVFLPMTTAVTFTWSEAVPDAAKAELRANANIYHTLFAEEGVLHARAMVIYEVSRGETSAVELDVPADVQINTVVAPDGGVSDWRLTRTRGKPGKLTVFLDRKISGEFRFNIEYERLLGLEASANENIRIPLLRVSRAYRQRGMVALLAGRELTLVPIEDSSATRVGENQLPKFVLETLDKTVAHTYKYVETTPELTVRASAPERKPGRFDVQIDTLISLGEVTMKGVARIEVDVKSGGIAELELVLPPNVNFLNLTAPSLRDYKLSTENGVQVIRVEFTQDMEGQFPVEVSYEKIMKDGETDVDVPTVGVRGPEVEQGRIAVEALAAMEVRAAAAEQLSTVELSQLPQHLILQTTNPILLAYKYVYADPPFRLTLKLTRHRRIEVQAAIIDEAHYQTLFTREGLAVTRARFTVRNAREQFLRVKLPVGSVVWKAFVAGQEERPALVGEGGGSADAPEIMIKIINSVDGFPVELFYKTPVSELGMLGTISGQLPRPHMIVTHTKWDVYLPDGLRYRGLESNLDLVDSGTRVDRAAMSNEVAAETGYGSQALHITVPTAGIRYRFEKLYANQSSRSSSFSLTYVSPTGSIVEQTGVALGALFLLGGALFLWARRQRVVWIGRKRVFRILAIAGVVVGGALLVGTVGYLGTSPDTPVVIGVIALIGLMVKLAWDRRGSIMRLPSAVLARTRAATRASAPAPVPATAGAAAGATAGAAAGTTAGAAAPPFDPAPSQPEPEPEAQPEEDPDRG